MLEFCDIAYCFRFRRKSKNWKLQSIFNFCFSAKISQIVCNWYDKSTPGGGCAWIKSWEGGLDQIVAPTPIPTRCGSKQEISRLFRNVSQRFLSFRRLILLFCPLWQAARHSTLAEKEKILDFALQLLMSPYRDFLELFRQVDMLFIARGWLYIRCEKIDGNENSKRREIVFYRSKRIPCIWRRILETWRIGQTIRDDLMLCT